jgi:hypothetical protein
LILLGAFRKGGSCRQAPRKTGAKSKMRQEADGWAARAGSATIDRLRPGGARQKTPWTALALTADDIIFQFRSMC